MDQQYLRPSFWKSRFGIVATVVAVVTSAYLYLVHKDHVLALLPYAFLAACPLMHMFIHHGHEGHGSHARGDARDPDGSPRG